MYWGWGQSSETEDVTMRRNVIFTWTAANYIMMTLNKIDEILLLFRCSCLVQPQGSAFLQAIIINNNLYSFCIDMRFINLHFSDIFLLRLRRTDDKFWQIVTHLNCLVSYTHQIIKHSTRWRVTWHLTQIMRQGFKKIFQIETFTSYPSQLYKVRKVLRKNS